MAKILERIDDTLRAFIAGQRMFFVATAAPEGRVNLSPKGHDVFRIIDDLTVCYLDLTGSGSETSAHLAADGRITLMFCAFEGRPSILRLYGRGRSLFRGSPDYADRLAAFYDGQELPGARQIVEVAVEMVQTSCGFAVPLFSYEGDRSVLVDWATQKGETGLRDYRLTRNKASIDGLPTGMDFDAVPGE